MDTLFKYLFKHRKYWYRIEKDKYKRYNSVQEAKEDMGFIDNPAFPVHLCKNIEWALHEEGKLLSYTVTFESDQKQNEWYDIKHSNDHHNCGLSSRVAFDPGMDINDWP